LGGDGEGSLLEAREVRSEYLSSKKARRNRYLYPGPTTKLATEILREEGVLKTAKREIGYKPVMPLAAKPSDKRKTGSHYPTSGRKGPSARKNLVIKKEGSTEGKALFKGYKKPSEAAGLAKWSRHEAEGELERAHRKGRKAFCDLVPSEKKGTHTVGIN